MLLPRLASRNLYRDMVSASMLLLLVLFISSAPLANVFAALLLEASMIVRVTSRTRREEGDGEGEGGSEMMVENRASSLASLVLPWDETVVVMQMVVPCSGVLASCRPKRSYSAMAKERASRSRGRRRGRHR